MMYLFCSLTCKFVKPTIHITHQILFCVETFSREREIEKELPDESITEAGLPPNVYDGTNDAINKKNGPIDRPDNLTGTHKYTYTHINILITYFA